METSLFMLQALTSPIIFTGTEIGLGFSLTAPLLAKVVQVGCRNVGRLAEKFPLAPDGLRRLATIPERPIRWLPKGTARRVFGASFLYSSYMFGLKGLPDSVYPFFKRTLLDPLESLGVDRNSVAYRFLDGGLVLGVGPYLNHLYGSQVLFQSEQSGRYTKADPLIWLSDYASNVFLFCPLAAWALRAPVLPFMISGALLYWAAILGAAHMTSVWAPQGKETHIVIGRATIFLLTNSALALKANSLISPRATNGIQLGVALALSALTYYVTRHEGEALTASQP